MKKILWIVVILLVVGGGGFFGYRALAGNQTSTTTDVQTAQVTLGRVAATINAAGTVRSGQSAIISWQTSGKVGEVKVNLGDQVQEDQELATLDQNALSAAMINARQNLINAKKALDNLQNTKLQQAQALQTVVDAQSALGGLKQGAAEKSSQAQLNLAKAEQALVDAQKKRNAMNYPHSTDLLVIQNAETNYQMAKKAYNEALKAFNMVDHKALTDPERARALKNLLAAKQKMDSTLTTYNWYLLKPSANDIAQADGVLAMAEANLAKAQADWEALKNGPTSSEITLAEARLADAQREWDLRKNGPSADDVAAAQTAVDVAQATLDQMHLLAPFAGTITDLTVNVGDLVNSGKQAFRIDDLSAIFIDLQVAEVDVNSLKVGQPTSMTFDAIPNQQYQGKVTKVGTIGAVSQGVVNYPITVQILDLDENVKFGMTATVIITIAEHSNVLVVPNQAIRVSGSQRTVVILFDGQQISVPVTVGLMNETISEVSSDLLKEGDAVVVSASSAVQTNNNNRNRPFGGGFGEFMP